jgi:hypothetical protein
MLRALSRSDDDHAVKGLHHTAETAVGRQGPAGAFVPAGDGKSPATGGSAEKRLGGLVEYRRVAVHVRPGRGG